MRATLASLAAAAVLAGCGYVSDYEASVYDEEPVYCYQSIGGGSVASKRRTTAISVVS